MAFSDGKGRVRGGGDATPGPYIRQEPGFVDSAARAGRYGHGSAVLWFTGLSGAGKTTIATSLEARLFQRGMYTYRLDGDNLRHGICSDLGFSREDRAENIRRAGHVAALFADAGMIVLACFISPYQNDREQARRAAGGATFIEIFVDCPLAECERRDPKQLYQKARAGKIPNFTGVSDAYEAPTSPDLTVRTDRLTIDQAVDQVIEYLQQRGVIPTGWSSP